MSVEIYFSMRDKLSDALKNITGNAKTTKEKLDDLAGEVLKAEDKFSNLRMELDKSNKVLGEARKTFLKLDDAASTLDYKKAIEANQKIRKEFKEQERAVKQVSNAYDELDSKLSKTDNRIAAMNSSRNYGSGTGGFLSSLKTAGAISVAGSLVVPGITDYANYLLSSNLGSDDAQMASATLSGGLSGAVSGAAVGQMLIPIPGLGAAIGAVAGGLLGAGSSGLSALSQQKSQKEDYFKQYTSDITSKVGEKEEAFKTSGLDLAANREQIQVSLNSLLKDKEAAEKLYADVKAYSDVTPYTLDQIAGTSRLLSVGFKNTDEIMNWMKNITDSAAAIGMGESDMEEMTRALTKIKNQGKASREFLDMWSDRGVNVYEAIAKYKKINQADVFDKISKGEINAKDTLDAIDVYVKKEHGGASETMGKDTYSGLLSTLEGKKNNLQSAYGEGYQEARKPAVQKYIDYLDKNGEKLSQLYKKQGEYDASLLNKQEEIEMQNYNQLLNTFYPKYEGLENPKSGLSSATNTLFSPTAKLFTKKKEKPSIQNASPVDVSLALQALIGKNVTDYNNSDLGLQATQMQKMLEESIRNMNTGEGSASWEALYDNSKVLMGGYAKAAKETDYASILNGAIHDSMAGKTFDVMANINVKTNVNTSTTTGTVRYSGSKISRNSLVENPSNFGLLSPFSSDRPNGFASGLSRVPYDGYPALLHEGERVQTAQEVRQQEAGQPVSVTITGNTFVVRQDSDIEAIAQELARRLEIAGKIMG